MKTGSDITTWFTTLTLALAGPGKLTSSDTTPSPPARQSQKPLVQIALLLDTSNSMDGLIEQAKSQLWKICNEFIKARQNGLVPELQVALYEYGNTRLARDSGWVRQVVPLTTDLDKISEELFRLRTSGGEEYCGWVIQRAVEELAWNPSANVYKAIFIAGNEPFTQGPVNYADACKAAIARGIIVNTIHCGSEAEGVNGKWRDGAELRPEDLPEPMQKMSAEEWRAFIEKHTRRRSEIQTRINQLNAAREKYVAQRMSEVAGTNTLDSAVISAIRDQAQKRNLTFE